MSSATTILRKPEVKARCGFKSDSTLYAAIAKGDFPRQLKLGSGCAQSRSVGWVEAEVISWVQARIAQRDALAV